MEEQELQEQYAEDYVKRIRQESQNYPDVTPSGYTREEQIAARFFVEAITACPLGLRVYALKLTECALLAFRPEDPRKVFLTRLEEILIDEKIELPATLSIQEYACLDQDCKTMLRFDGSYPLRNLICLKRLTEAPQDSMVIDNYSPWESNYLLEAAGREGWIGQTGMVIDQLGDGTVVPSLKGLEVPQALKAKAIAFLDEWGKAKNTGELMTGASSCRKLEIELLQKKHLIEVELFNLKLNAMKGKK